MVRFSSVLIAATAVAASAAAAPAGGLEIAQSWSRPAMAGGTAAGFMTIANHGKAADALVAVASPLATRSEIHRSSMDSGVMRMSRIDRVAIAPGTSATFAPGGLHVMFIGLKRGLKAGDSAPATLTFASGRVVKTTFVVSVAPPPSASGMKSHDHMGH